LPKAPSLPLGLEPGQVQALTAWGDSPAGRTWALALDRLFEVHQEQLAGRLSHDDYQFQCGVVHALRVVAMLPDTLTAALEAQRARDTRRTRDDITPDWDLNSPWFSRAHYPNGSG
jgi:hypothetical protein